MTSPPQDAAPVKPRILVVEDEYFIAEEIADALAAAGYAVVGPCPSVRQAMAWVEGCDAAVLDASLRGESSLPVAEALAEQAKPFAVVTGFSASQLPPAMAAVPVLAKPLRARDLLKVLEELLPRN
ncbi:response regulator [Erythrobacter sp. NE805]|uniref:response regulator n=1 Tax=Erythrobacter sp. NE805 TaxID=3389875 RepID=UPI00396B2918